MSDCCGKAVLVIINIFFIIFGVVCFGGGLFLKFGQTLLRQVAGPIIESFLSSVPSDGSSSSSDALDQFFKIVDLAAYALIALGAFMLLVGIFGCCGACCSNKVLLILYVITVLLVFIAKIIILAFWLNKTFDQQLFDSMKNDLYEKYLGPFALNQESLILNIIMIQLHCCGIDNYTEFANAKNWNRTVYYNGIPLEQEIPGTCCVTKGSFPDVEPVDKTCTVRPNTLNSYIDTSCHTAVEAEVEKVKTTIIGVYAGILAFEIICVAIAICLLVRQEINQKQNRIHPESKNNQQRY